MDPTRRIVRPAQRIGNPVQRTDQRRVPYVPKKEGGVPVWVLLLYLLGMMLLAMKWHSSSYVDALGDMKGEAVKQNVAHWSRVGGETFLTLDGGRAQWKTLGDKREFFWNDETWSSHRKERR